MTTNDIHIKLGIKLIMCGPTNDVVTIFVICEENIPQKLADVHSFAPFL